MSGRDIAALIAYIGDRELLPFAWGRDANDCVGYAAGAILAATGRDVVGESNWASERGAARVLARLGGMAAIMDARFGRVAPALAQRGDIAGVADDRFGVRLMVVEGATLVGPGSRGNRRVPRSAMTVAWSITSEPPA